MTTKREAVLLAIEEAFRSPATAPTNGTVWGRVLSSEWLGRATEAKTVLSVLEQVETYTETISPDKLDRDLDIELRCRTYIPTSENTRTGCNDVLGDMEEVVAANRHWTGLAINTSFLSNTIERTDTGDRVCEISLFIRVKYRSSRANPSVL